MVVLIVQFLALGFTGHGWFWLVVLSGKMDPPDIDISSWFVVQVDTDPVTCKAVDGLESFQLYFAKSRDYNSVPDLFAPHICAW